MSDNQVHIAITLMDGSLLVMHFIKEQRATADNPGWKREGTKEEIENSISRASQVWDSPVKSWRVIDISELPKDRTFRHAWTDDGTKITHDMAKVRDDHLLRIRYHRSVALAEMDKSWMRAMGQGNKKEAAKIEADRQTLRDLPVTTKNAMDSAKTPKEVNDIWHPLLPKNPKKI
jgi:hypothetical protein